MSEDDSGRFEIADSYEFPSLDVALDEIRKSYDVEQARKSNIEVKTGGIVGINALLISVVSTVGTVGFAASVIILLPALSSTVLGLVTLRPRQYTKPGPEPNEIFAYARRDKTNSHKDFIQNYRKAINQNHETNNDRMGTLTICFWLTGASFILVTGAPLVESGIQLVAHYLFF